MFKDERLYELRDNNVPLQDEQVSVSVKPTSLKSSFGFENRVPTKLTLEGGISYALYNLALASGDAERCSRIAEKFNLQGYSHELILIGLTGAKHDVEPIKAIRDYLMYDLKIEEIKK